MSAPDPRAVREGEIVQLAEGHKWFLCLAVVEEVKGWGVKASIRVPHDHESTAEVPLRLAWHEFYPVGARPYAGIAGRIVPEGEDHA